MYISLYRSGHYMCFILAYFTYFENIEVGLCDNLAVCVHMYRWFIYCDLEFGHYMCFILAYFTYFEHMEVGLCGNLAVCMHMCVGDLFIVI
jgi:hypothetical protein